jgi:hypothetical protein
MTMWTAGYTIKAPSFAFIMTEIRIDGVEIVPWESVGPHVQGVLHLIGFADSLEDLMITFKWSLEFTVRELGIKKLAYRTRLVGDYLLDGVQRLTKEFVVDFIRLDQPAKL